MKREFAPRAETRIVNGKEFTVVYLKPEDPQKVRERDHVGRDFIGRKPMGKDAFGNKIGLKVVGTNIDGFKGRHRK